MAETFITNQGIEYLYKLPNSKIDEDEGAEYGIILSRNQIENLRYNSDIVSFLNQLPNLRIITEKDFIEKTKNLLMDFFETHPVNALQMNSHWIKKFMKKNYQILKHIDPVFDILVNKDPKFCGISNYLLFSILGNNNNNNSNTQVNTESNYTLYRKVKDPASSGKSKKVLHSVCTFNFCSKELVIDAVCANKNMYFKGAGMLLNVLMDMGVYLKLPSIRLRSVDNINSIVFYIKNSLIPVSFSSIAKIVDEDELIPMVGDLDIRVRSNWKLNSIVDKNLVNLKTPSYVPAFTLSKSPDSEKVNTPELFEESPSNSTSENENKLYEKYTSILNFMKSTILGISNVFSNEAKPKEKTPIFTKEVIELLKDKILEIKDKNKELVQKHNEKLRNMKEEYKNKVNKPAFQNIAQVKPVQIRAPPQPKVIPPLPPQPKVVQPHLILKPPLPPPLSPLDEVAKPYPIINPVPVRAPRAPRAERPPRNAAGQAKVTQTNNKKKYSPKNKTPKKI